MKQTSTQELKGRFVMATFKQFLEQQHRSAQFVDNVSTQCRPYLQSHQTFPSEPLYRGVKNNSDSPFIFKQVRHDRAPKTTVISIHQLANQWFEQQFGIPFRSAINGTGDFRFASDYGDVFQVFPTGDFKFCWSPKVRDFVTIESRVAKETKIMIDDAPTLSSVFTVLDVPANQLSHSLFEIVKTILFDILDQAEYQTTNITEAIRSKNEIMIATNYYGIHSWYSNRDQVIDKIQQQMDPS